MSSAIVAAVATAFIGVAAVTQCAPARGPIPRALAESRLAAEEAVATTLGFVREHEEEVHAEGPIVRALSVEPGECIAALAGFFDGSAPGSIVVVPRGGSRDHTRSPDALAAHLEIDGVVGHVQWCADRHVEVDVVVRVSQDGETSPGTILRLLRAPASVGLTSEGLVRGRVLLDPATVLGALDAATSPVDAVPSPDAGDVLER